MNPLAIGASLLGGIFSARSAASRNKKQIALAREQMRFQERMSSTAYQRAADDLEKAGLNRVLALGNSASTPGGAMPQIQDEGAPAVATALAVKRQAAEIKNIEANTSKTVEDTINARNEGSNILQNFGKITAEINNLRKQGRLLDVQRDVQDALRKIKDSEAIIIKSEEDLYRELQNIGASEETALTRLLGPQALSLVKLFIMSNR